MYPVYCSFSSHSILPLVLVSRYTLDATKNTNSTKRNILVTQSNGFKRPPLQRKRGHSATWQWRHFSRQNPKGNQPSPRVRPLAALKVTETPVALQVQRRPSGKIKLCLNTLGSTRIHLGPTSPA